MNSVLERVYEIGIIPVIAFNSVDEAIPLCKALMDGGLPAAEVTFRTACAEECIKKIHEELPNMLLGAGTVLTPAQADAAIEAGASFIVSPGFDEEVVRWCTAHDVAVCPGCVTPTEVMAALRCGLSVVKFFPANVYGGLSGMKALSAPFGGVRFIPTGGVSATNLKEYAAAPFVCAVGGSWLCPKKEIAAGNFEKVEQLCREAHSILDA